MSAAKANTSNIFLNQDGSIRISIVLVVVAVPLIISGQWLLGLVTLGAGCIASLCSLTDQIKEDDKQEIRYNIMDADDVVKELVLLEANIPSRPQDENNSSHLEQVKIHCIAGLNALAKKWSQEQTEEQQKNNHFALNCQQAAYISIRLFSFDDSALSAAFSLLALVAKNDQVRERHLFAADEYGLDKPVESMQKALNRARDVEDDPDKEQECAELQRKACLLLGALADGDSDIATKIVDEGGLRAILETLKWYRFHEDVANWGLWAIFILCYENPPNKAQNVQLGGVPVVLQTMQNITDCEEVARHGIAILFDHMKEEPGSQQAALDVWKVRNFALNAGLHDIIVKAMQSFRNSFQIIMMGREILVGTNYPGQIPNYEPSEQ